MDKTKLLIVAHHLTIGGVQKSLISALKVLDYEKYDVTLYLRKNRRTLLPYVDERIKVVFNEDTHHYYRKPVCVLLQVAEAFCSKMGLKKQGEKFNKLLGNKIREYEMKYEKKTYFDSEKYDIAVAYVQGYTALFVDKYINAHKKYVFFHASTDEYPDVHKDILADFHKVVALHNDQKNLLSKWYPEISGKICIVENYTDKEMIVSQSKEEKIYVPEDKTVLCSCGRFAPVKGFDLAVEAAKILKDKGIGFLWYFVGDGPEREKLEKLIEKYSLEDYIVITGMKSNPYPYMAQCNIYVQPSYEEAMPVTILEAHRLCKPVVTTATVGGQALVKNGQNGVITEITSIDVAEGILSLIKDNKKMKEMNDRLENTDYSLGKEKYKNQWKKLLEG